MRTRVLLAGLALGAAATSLTACGSSGGSDGGSSSGSNSTDDYCSELKADKTYFESLQSGDVSKLDEAFSKIHTLADDAPSEVAADWKVFDSAVTTVEKALKDAGIKVSDLAGIQKGQLPKGVDPQQLQQLGPKLQALGDEKISTAGKAIEAHAKKECKVDLSSSSSS